MIHERSEGTRRRVLVVDDERDAAESWAILLRKWGFDVDVALDGHLALLAATENPPDAVLLDIGMPVLDGYEVARRLRDRVGPKLLVLAVTGHAQPLDRVAAKEAGADLHFAKPADPEQIREALRRLDRLPKATLSTTSPPN